MSIVVLFLVGCSTVVRNYDPPSSEEEFYAETRIIALEDRISISEAKSSLSRTYPEFAEEDGFSIFSPMARSINFINCTSTISPSTMNVRGRTTVTYRYSGRTRRRRMTDSCSGRYMTKFYCVGERVAMTQHRCSSGCWMGEHCK